jgi:hypothetical protein
MLALSFRFRLQVGKNLREATRFNCGTIDVPSDHTVHVGVLCRG